MSSRYVKKSNAGVGDLDFGSRVICIDPAFHPKRSRPAQGVNEEHQQDSGIHPDVPVAECSDCVYIGAVDSRCRTREVRILI